MNKTILSALALVITASTYGCSSDAPPTTTGANNSSGSTSSGSSGDMQAPEFPEGTGQAKTPEVAYPKGPFGIKKGSIVENFKFIGFVDSTTTSNALQPIELADFYNPTGTDVYPKGSLHGEGKPKPKALLIDIGSVWCPPCNNEAGSVLPGQYKKFEPMGGQFLEMLADGPTPGTPATQKNLFNWTKKYKVDFPAAIDPSYKLGPLFAQEAFPNNIIVDTRTMKICQVIAGEPIPGDTAGGGAAFWAKFDAVIADSKNCK